MFEKDRLEMVDKQIIARGVAHNGIIEAMRRIPRHLFVPEEHRRDAYADHPVHIGHGQTISQPYIVACMLELSEPGPSKRLLEIGSGSGYLVAVAASLFKEVVGIERIEELCTASRAALQATGVTNAHIICADGYEGEEGARFDSIIVSCSCSRPPPPLLEQLSPGGVFVAPVGDVIFQELVVVRRSLQGDLSTEIHGGVRFVPLISPHEA